MLKLIKPSDWLIVFILQYAEVDQAIWLVDCVYFVVCWSWSCHLIGWLCLFCSMLKLIMPSDWLIVFILQYAEVDHAIWLVDCVYLQYADRLIVFILWYAEVDQAVWLVDCVYLQYADWLIVFICSMLIGWLCLFAVCWSWSSHLIGWLCLFCRMLDFDWLIVFIL